MKKENRTNKVITKRKPPIIRKKRKMAEVISLEEYCLKKINASPLSKEFFYDSLTDTIENLGGYGTKGSLEVILRYLDLYHEGAKVGMPYLILEQRGLL